MSLQYNVARSAMGLVASMGKAGYLSNLGLTKDDFDKITGELPWIGSDRNRVTQAFNSLMFGTIDALGLPRFQIPAEWIAACITVFVSPVNTHAACRFFERSSSADSISRSSEFDDVTAEVLFSLCIQLHADVGSSAARTLFEKNTNLKIQKAVPEVAVK